MQFTVDRTSFLHLLQIVSTAVASKTTQQVLVNTGDFIRAIDRAMVIAPRSLEVRLAIQEGITWIETQSPEFGHLRDVIPTNYTSGKDICIAFHAKNVLDAVRTFRSEETIVRLTGPNQPFLVIPNENQTSVHVISPIVTR